MLGFIAYLISITDQALQRVDAPAVTATGITDGVFRQHATLQFSVVLSRADRRFPGTQVVNSNMDAKPHRMPYRAHTPCPDRSRALNNHQLKLVGLNYGLKVRIRVD